MIRIVKKALHSLLAMALVLGAVIMSSSTSAYADHGAVQFAGGDGTSGTPYLIATPEQLNEVRNHLSEHFQLIADIDLTAYLGAGGDGWVPIGSTFTGTFDGNHHTISGLRISNYIGNGLFRHINGSAEIKNVGLIDVDITCSQNCGGLVGINEGNISNSSVTGSVYGSKEFGGLVGSQSSGSISNSFANVNVYGTQYAIGGLVGLITGGSISNSYAAGSVHGNSAVGGLVGYQMAGDISNSYATGSVSLTGSSGGLLGHETVSSSVTNSFYDVDTTGQSDTGKGTGKETSDMQDKSTYENAGWDFTNHWNIDTSGNAQRHNNGKPYLRAIQAYVTYDGNGNTEGEAPFDSTSYRPSRSATVAGNTGDLAITGYTLAGWNTAANGSGTSYNVGDSFVITGDITLYAQWEISTYTVTFNAEGGNVNPLEQTKRFASTYGHGADGVVEEGLPSPTRTGYTFAGWYDGPGGTGNEVTDATTVQTTSDHPLYAKWTINQYTLSYDGNGSTGGTVPGSVTQDYNTSLTVAGNTGDLAITGYTLAGWNTAANGSGTSYDEGDTITIGASDVTLYAKWTLIEYAVNFDVDGGSTVPSVNAAHDTTITAPTAPTKANYSFGGWYKESTLTNTWDFDTDKVLGATTLYAKWTLNHPSNNGGGNTPTVQPEILPEPKPFYIEHVNIDVIKALVEKAKSAPELTFKDIPEGSSTAKTIGLATKLGIIKGYADGTFRADAKVTRAEFATMLVKALGLSPEGHSSFKDTEGHWAADAIATLKAKGIINGYLDGTFKPNQSISRAEIVAMLSQVMNLTLVQEVKFKDISGNWAEDEINTLSDMGIVKGTSDDLFEPNAKATRHESLLMILRMLNASLGYTIDVE